MKPDFLKSLEYEMNIIDCMYAGCVQKLIQNLKVHPDFIYVKHYKYPELTCLIDGGTLYFEQDGKLVPWGIETNVIAKMLMDGELEVCLGISAKNVEGQDELKIQPGDGISSSKP